MRYNIILIFCFLFAQPLNGQGVIDTTELVKGKDSEKISNEAPNPSSLQSNWYTYFQVEPDQAFQRIDQFIKNLETKVEPLSESEKRIAKQHIERLSTGIRALIQSRQTEPPSPPAPLSIKENYTQTMLMEAFRELNVAKAEVARLIVDVKELDEKLQIDTRNLNNARTRYRAILAPNTEKFLLGLNIMGHWASLTVGQEELSQATTRLKHAQFLLEQHHQEITEAEKRLIVGENGKKLEGEINLLNEVLTQQEEQLLQKETMTVGQLPNTPLGKATKAHLIQQTLLARVLLTTTQINLQIASMKANLEQLVDSTQKTVDKKLFDFLEIEAEKRSRIHNLIPEWIDDTDREHTRAFEGQQRVPSDELNQRQLLLRNQQRIETANATRAAITQLKERLNEASYFASVLESRAVNQWSQLGQIGLKVEEAAEDVWKATLQILKAPLFWIGDVPVTLWGLIRAALILIIVFWLSRGVEAALQKMGDQQKKITSSSFYSLGRLSHYFIVFVGSLLALLSLGLDLTTLALVAGALSVGIGFGLQGIVNNFLSGILILFESQMKVGDFIELESGYRGVVTAINMRSTTLRTNRGIEVLIPNSEITENRTINWTMTDDYRRIHVPFGVSYSSDKELVRKVVLEAADRVPHTVKGVARYRDPVVWLTGFGDNALNFELVVWVSSPASKSMSRATADYYWEIHSALTQNAIEIPFPQRDLHLRNINPDLSSFTDTLSKI